MDYLEISELYHHGIKGQKWGIRRFQNKDGSLTPEGEKRYNNDISIVNTSEKKKGLTTPQKILIGVGGVSVAALATYGAVKTGMYVTDTIIKSGTTIQRISSNSAGSLHKEFYASNNKHDNKRYEGLFPEHLKNKNGNDSYKHIYKTEKDIKVASNAKAKTVYKQLVKEGKISAATNYDEFNKNLVNRNVDSKIFYEALSKKGYGAIQDINDKKYSGYNAKSPLIFFGDSSSSMKISSSTKINHLPKNYNKELIKSTVETIGKSTVVPGTIGAASIYAKQLDKQFNLKVGGA